MMATEYLKDICSETYDEISYKREKKWRTQSVQCLEVLTDRHKEIPSTLCYSMRSQQWKMDDNSYFFHRIINGFSADIECTIILKPFFLVPRCRRHGLKKLVLIL